MTTPHPGGPVTERERELAALFIGALRDPDRPRLNDADTPEQMDTDGRYELAMHLARIAAAHGFLADREDQTNG